MLEHLDPLGAHPEREALVALGVEPTRPKNDRMDHPRAEDRHPPRAAAGRAADPATGMSERDEVSQALTRLEPEHQVVLVLRFWLDLPVDAIAQRLGIPAGTVKSRLHNAGRRLRQALDDGGGRR